MKNLVVYGRSVPPCSSCNNLKTLLDSKSIPYEYKDISDTEVFTEFCNFRLRSVPAVFEDGTYIGGFDTVQELLKGE